MQEQHWISGKRTGSLVPLQVLDDPIFDTIGIYCETPKGIWMGFLPKSKLKRKSEKIISNGGEFHLIMRNGIASIAMKVRGQIQMLHITADFKWIGTS